MPFCRLYQLLLISLAVFLLLSLLLISPMRT